MMIDHKFCVACARTMSADDAHHECQPCRIKAADARRSPLARIVYRHTRRWQYAQWQRRARIEGRR